MNRIEFVAWMKHFAWICYMMGAEQELPFYEWPPSTSISIRGQADAISFLDTHPNATSEDNHNNWTYSKLKDGWTYGQFKDIENKTHPDLVPYSELPEVERRKDDMDILAYAAGNMFWAKLFELSPLQMKKVIEDGEEDSD